MDIKSPLGNLCPNCKGRGTIDTEAGPELCLLCKGEGMVINAAEPLINSPVEEIEMVMTPGRHRSCEEIAALAQVAGFSGVRVALLCGDAEADPIVRLVRLVEAGR